MKLLIMHFLQPPVTSTILGPNILLSTLMNTLSLFETMFQTHTKEVYEIFHFVLITK